MPQAHSASRRTDIVAYLGLGSNLGDRLAALRAAVEAMDRLREVAVCEASPVYESEAHTLHSKERQPPFLNAVVKVVTSLPPEVLLEACLRVERAAGRVRRRRWAARPLDIDLLLYGGETINRAGLTVPHPRMAERRFVLQPLVDLEPGLYVPAPFEALVTDLLQQCTDQGPLRRLEQPLLLSSLPS